MEEKEMNEIIQIMKLMEQAPNFSTVAFAVFAYCAFKTIKSFAKEQVDEKVKNSMNEFKKDFNNNMDERLKPMEKKVENIEKNVYLLISNICPKNGF
jgi:tryptophanyl-tRNA synthetase